VCLTLLTYNYDVIDKSIRSALREMDEGKSSSFLRFVRVISSADVRKCLALDTGRGKIAGFVGILLIFYLSFSDSSH
jgi:hypothetical protein